MRKLITINLGGRLKANLKVDNNINMFFEIISGNRKIISYIPVFSSQDAFQLYKDFTGKELQKTMRDYIRDLMKERDNTYQYWDIDRSKD